MSIEPTESKMNNSDKESLQQELKLASQGLRIIHLLVDLIVAFLLGFLCFIIIDLTYKDPLEESVEAFSTGLFYLTTLSYFIFMEYKFQKTLGKFLTKSRVVLSDGSKPKLIDIILRTLCRLIPFEFLSYWFSNIGFHDLLSNTRVIKD